MSALTVTIDTLGARGEGIARSEAGPLFVPFALPGESVSVAAHRDRGTLIAVKQASPERVEPPCPHFGPDGIGGACGGCALQHYGPSHYEAWKRGLVVKALADRGISERVEPLAVCAPGERRRMTLAARRTERGFLLGFSQARSHKIVPIHQCAIAAPAIAGRLDMLRRVAAAIAVGSKPFRVNVLVTASGLDIAATGAGRLSERHRRAAVEIALSEGDIARVTVDGETLVEPRKPLIHFGDVPVTPPPGAFLQASARAEAVMAGLVGNHLQGAKRIADLFAGCGTFGLRLARHSAVHAVESERSALAALEGGFRSVQGLKPVTVERRDLFRSPLVPFDLRPFEGIVFDPPRVGAEAQTRQLAEAGIPRIAAVSCNPATLARDLSILVAGGYRIARIQPVDQFLWSPHVEVVALLER